MSQHLPALRPAKVLKALQRAGFYIHHTKGSHHFLKHPAKRDDCQDQRVQDGSLSKVSRSDCGALLEPVGSSFGMEGNSCVSYVFFGGNRSWPGTVYLGTTGNFTCPSSESSSIHGR